MDYNSLLMQECPAFIVEHVQSADIYTSESLFWPKDYIWPDDFPPQCIVAMLGVTTPKMHPDAPQRRLSSYFYYTYIFSADLPEELVRDIAEVAKGLPIGDDLAYSYFRALRALKIDVRTEIAAQFLDTPPDVPMTQFIIYNRYYQYMLYRLSLDDREAKDWIIRLIDRLVLADDIIEVHDDLKANGVPGWEDILRRSITDTRQSPGVSGCGGMIVGQNVEFQLGIWPLTPMKGNIVLLPGQTLTTSCGFDR